MIKQDLLKAIAKSRVKSVFIELKKVNYYNDSLIDTLEIAELKPSGKPFSRSDVLRTFDEQWGQFYGKGRWGGKEFTRSNYTGSDSSYYCMSLNFCVKVINIVNHIIREIFKAVWTEQIFDCDDFANMSKAILAWVLFQCGIRNDGAGVGVIKVDYEQDGKLSGHALNCLPIYDNDKLKWFLYESQNTDIYAFPKDWQIHFFDI